MLLGKYDHIVYLLRIECMIFTDYSVITINLDITV